MFIVATLDVASSLVWAALELLQLRNTMGKGRELLFWQRVLGEQWFPLWCSHHSLWMDGATKQQSVSFYHLILSQLMHSTET